MSVGFSVTVKADGKVQMVGDTAAMKRLRKKAVRVCVPQDVPFIIMVQAMGNFLTYGPVGGSRVPYQMIEWAHGNAPAYGVSIQEQDGINMPVIWLPNKKLADAMLASLNASLDDVE